MKVINTSNQKLIADKIKIANNPITRTIGLLNKSKLNKGEGLLIVPCNGIHSFGMRFNFDAVFLGKDNKVQHLIKDMRPWRVSSIIKGAYKVLELPSGTIDDSKIDINDILEFA